MDSAVAVHTNGDLGIVTAVPDRVVLVDPRKLLRRVARGSVKNVSFDDLARLVEAFGFERKRVSGSHHIYGHPDLSELVNLQEVSGQAKPYQVRQLMKLVERYALKLREDR